MDGIGSSTSNTQQNIERRAQAQETQQARVQQQQQVEKATTVQPTQPSVVAEDAARTPAAASDVAAARTRAAGNEDAVKNRLAQADTPNAGAQPRRGLLKGATDSCPVTDGVDRGELSIDQLRTDVRGKGSGRGISNDDGTNCAPDPNRVIDV